MILVQEQMQKTYSYRDNNGAVETVYSSNSKVWIKDASDDSLVWGTAPDFDTVKVIGITASIFATILENDPDTSYATGATAWVNSWTNYATEIVHREADPGLSDFGSVLHTEIWLKQTGSSGYLNSTTFDIMGLTATPDSTPTWNEVTPNIGETIVSRAASSDHLNTMWMFHGATLNAFAHTTMTDYSNTHGSIMKFRDEATSNGTQYFGSYSVANATLEPLILVAYLPTARRRIFVVGQNYQQYLL